MWSKVQRKDKEETGKKRRQVTKIDHFGPVNAFLTDFEPIQVMFIGNGGVMAVIVIVGHNRETHLREMNKHRKVLAFQRKLL